MHLVVSPTDIAYAIFGLYDGKTLRNTERIDGAPEELLKHLFGYLSKNNMSPEDVESVIVVTGPGSFTSIRAGSAVVNTFAFVHDVPLVPIENPKQQGLSDLLVGINLENSVSFVTPAYGREPNITKSGKS